MPNLKSNAPMQVVLFPSDGETFQEVLLKEPRSLMLTSGSSTEPFSWHATRKPHASACRPCEGSDLHMHMAGWRLGFCKLHRVCLMQLQ